MGDFDQRGEIVNAPKEIRILDDDQGSVVVDQAFERLRTGVQVGLRIVTRQFQAHALDVGAQGLRGTAGGRSAR